MFFFCQSEIVGFQQFRAEKIRFLILICHQNTWYEERPELVQRRGGVLKNSAV